ncbi:hypothetical protein ABZ883_16995 [Streptomyces sp. NPDC046977]|uniref:hypothetical protein n=1 Tax=Streptomyces sp. NPDC046977 TaxID=3154703 RepID=UPI003404978D
MRVLQKAEERSRGFLEPGESVRQVFVAQGGINPWATMWMFAGAVMLGIVARRLAGEAPWLGLPWLLIALVVALLATTRRVVLVTDRAVVTLAMGRWGTTRPNRVVARLPLGTRIGPLSGTYAKVELGGERLWIHKKFHGSAPASAAAPPRR